MKHKIIIIAVFINTLISYSQQIGDGFAPSTIPNFSAALKSGIYNGLTNSTIGMVPDNSHAWQHLFAMRHINQSNNYQLQIASTFVVNDRLFFRKITAGDLSASNTTWNELATRGANNFVGNQNITGNLGIGTTKPRATLDMAKDISNGQLGTVFGRLPEGDGTGLGTYLGVKGYTTQGTDYNNIKSFSIVHDFYGQTNSSINFYRGGAKSGGFITFNTSENTEKMRILANGNIGIGSTNPDSKLTVNGTIRATEVKVTQTVPADYVFQKYYLGESSLKPNYKLLTLSEVEKFTKENHHLPNVPSAKEIQENGLHVGEMSNILLQKIEELTLYSIEQQKTIEKLKKENEYFKKLEERLAKIENQLNN